MFKRLSIEKSYYSFFLFFLNFLFLLSIAEETIKKERMQIKDDLYAVFI
jgi:hypothetical protein